MSVTKVNGISFRTPSGIRFNFKPDKLNANLQKAQFWLDTQIMTDMKPYMPMDKGIFIANTVSKSAALAGSGLVCAAAPPYGRYLYYGKVMVDSETGKGARPIRLKTGKLIFRHRKGATLVPTGRSLTYQNPYARPEWFEVAKAEHEQDWVNGVAKILGGKVNG